MALVSTLPTKPPLPRRQRYREGSVLKPALFPLHAFRIETRHSLRYVILCMDRRVSLKKGKKRKGIFESARIFPRPLANYRYRSRVKHSLNVLDSGAVPLVARVVNDRA